MTGFLVLKLAVILLLYLFLIAVTSLIYRDLAVTSAGEQSPPVAHRPRPSYSPRVQLVILEGPGRQKGQFFKLDDVTIIGREDSCAVVLEDPAASQQHVRLFKQEDRYWLEDLQSSNGTYLNGEPVDRPVPVKPGDRFQVGQTLLELVG